MRILAAGSCQSMGGVVTHFGRLVRFLEKEGHEVLVVGIGDGEEFMPVTQRGRRLRVRQNTAGLFGKIAKGLELSKALMAARGFRPELLISSAYGKSYAKIGAALGSSCYRFYHEVIFDPPPGDPLRNELVAAHDAIAVQAPSMREPFLKSIRTEKPVATLPHFNVPPLPGFEAKLPQPDETIRLVTFGRLAENKGLLPFLRVFARVVQSEEMTWDLHGTGPEKKVLEEEITKLGLSEKVRLHGRYPEGEGYAKLLCSYHALVLPSIASEGLPLVLLEAMGYGLVFLTTSIGAIGDCALGNPDVIMVPPSEEALENGLKELCARLRQGSLSGRRLKEKYEKEFSETAMQAEWSAMLGNPRGFFESGGTKGVNHL